MLKAMNTSWLTVPCPVGWVKPRNQMSSEWGEAKTWNSRARGTRNSWRIRAIMSRSGLEGMRLMGRRGKWGIVLDRSLASSSLAIIDLYNTSA